MEGAEDTQDRGQSAAFHPSASLWLAAALCDPSPTRPTYSQGWDPELHALGPHRKARGVTEKPSKVIGFLLLNGFVVECLKEDVQHQEVLPVGTPLCSAKRAGNQPSYTAAHKPPLSPSPPAPRCSQGPHELFRLVQWGHGWGMSQAR